MIKALHLQVELKQICPHIFSGLVLCNVCTVATDTWVLLITALGTLILCDPTIAARESTAAQVAADTGAVLVPPYDYGPVIAGQGTIGLEFLQQVKPAGQMHCAGLSLGSST